MRYACACGRFTVETGSNFVVWNVRCGQCPPVRQSWWMRLDEWQHRHERSFAWHVLWRPYCNWVDWRLGR